MFIWLYGFNPECVVRRAHQTRRVVHTTRRVWCSESPVLLKKVIFKFFWYLFDLVLFICTEKTMRKRKRGPEAPRDQGDFPWYNFPEVVSQRVLTEWRNKLEKMKRKEFYITNEVNWVWLEQVGLVEAMNLYLTKIFMNEGVRITCTGWRRLFQMHEPVYK